MYLFTIWHIHDTIALKGNYDTDAPQWHVCLLSLETERRGLRNFQSTFPEIGSFFFWLESGIFFYTTLILLMYTDNVTY